MLVDCGFTGLTKQGKGCQKPSEMIAMVENDDKLMLSNMTQVGPSIRCLIIEY